MKVLKPMKLSDCIIEKITYPVILEPKADGIRGLNQHGVAYSRTLKPFANQYAQRYLSQDIFSNLDFEIYVGNITDQDLCRNTTSALNSIGGTPSINLMVFDLLHSTLPYQERLYKLETRLRNLAFQNVNLVEWTVCYSEQHLLDLESMYLDKGYEGVVIRTVNGGYKEGRVGKTDPIATRIKRFTEEEAEVLRIEEAEENLNPQQVNELGLSFRTTHKENKVGKNALGTLVCLDVKTNQEIRVGAGKMNHDDRAFYFNNPNELVGKIIKYKHFPKGVKDKPRFPTFEGVVRPSWDLNND